MIQPLGDLWIVISGLSLWLGTWAQRQWLRWLSLSIFSFVAVGMIGHWLPGFNNLVLIDSHRFSPDSIPFKMYLNIDKTVIGIFILLIYLRPFEPKKFRRSDFLLTFKALVILIAVMMPLALLSHYVRWDPKFPPETWIWALNNLLLVCMAEECFFRGFVQGGLTKVTASSPRLKWLPMAVGAILFGLAHYQGGVLYVFLASIAGVFYGLVYWRTRKIEFPILVHFGLNLTHFLLFSYPALATTAL